MGCWGGGEWGDGMIALIEPGGGDSIIGASYIVSRARVSAQVNKQ